MEKKYYTIGMAGHIDHGKTTLTKALTNIDTDRLKEEKERQISIELGYAPLKLDDDIHVSVVDVPGHERFIRQMIAGVAGIDLVIMVIAADEGIMPQTREHLEILSFLGIERCIIAISKIDRVDEELLELVSLDIREQLEGTLFKEADICYVDSISKKGLDELKELIKNQLSDMKIRNAKGSFRLPIDQVFTLQGKGTVVRGTVYEGMVTKGSFLQILPGGSKVKARQIQVHRQEVEEARAGQRTAINLGGVNKDDIRRGNVLVSSDHFIVTQTIDVAVRFVRELRSTVKQRTLVKVHIGTAEVMGKIVFFDRNEVKGDDGEILCQIRLDEPIVTRRFDRFIVRRPTPVETIGGGWVIDPLGEKYRFGEETIRFLERKKEGSPEELVKDVLSEHKMLSFEEIVQLTSINEQDVLDALEQEMNKKEILKESTFYILKRDVDELQDEIQEKLSEYHTKNPMSIGVNKAEVVQALSSRYPKRVIEFVIDSLDEQNIIKKTEQYIALDDFTPHLDKKWEKRMKEIIQAVKNDGLAVKSWDDYTKNTLPDKERQELKMFMLQTKQGYALDEQLIIHKESIEQGIIKLKNHTEELFTLKEAKDAWGVSRKYLIPLLELLDTLQVTKRDGDKRKWVK